MTDPTIPPQPDEPAETHELGEPTKEVGEPVTPDKPAPDAAAPAAPAAGDDALAREVAQLRELVGELAARQSTPTAVPAAVITSERDDERIKEIRDRYADWPQRGGDLAQPWDAETLGLPRPGVDRPPLEGGVPDRITPVVPRAGLPLLSSGTQGDEVIELGRALGTLGYPNTVTRAENPYGVFDDSLAQAVEAFRRDYNVAEDPSQFVRDQATNARTHCGPWTIEAVLRAADREREAAAA